MAPDWLRFLTTTLGLAVSFGFYGAPTELRIPPADIAGVSLQQEMIADAESTGDSGTVDSGGKEQGGEGLQRETTADADSAPDAPSTAESENVSDESEESEAEGE